MSTPSRSHPNRLSSSDRPDGDARNGGGSWKKSAICAALAIIASAVFFAQLFSPASKLGGILGMETETFFAQKDGAVAAGRPTDTPHAEARAKFEQLLRPMPETPAHLSAARLLRLVEDAGVGRESDPELVKNATVYLNADGSNLIARMSFAVWADLRAGRASSAPVDVLRRFGAIKSIVDGQSAATKSTLYNAEFNWQWSEVLRGFFARRDVAAAMSRSLDHYQIQNQFVALPIVQRQISDLSKALLEGGHSAEADECRQWLARMALGLMGADPDAATRLLCADLLANSLDNHGEAATELRRLRNDFHGTSDTAMVDMIDPYRQPVVSPELYRKAFLRLVGCMAVMVFALGGAAMMIAGGAAATLLRMTGDAAHPPGESDTRLLPQVMAVVAATVAVSWLAQQGIDRGIPSEMWALARFVIIAAMGALFPVFLAIVFHRNGGRVRPGPAALIGTPILAIVGIMLIPPSSVLRYVRMLGSSFTTAWIVGGAMILLVLLAMVASRASFRSISRQAMMVWCVGAVFALANLQFQRLTDRHYQEHVIEARFDEITARLGPGWESKYLGPAQKLINTPSK